MQQLLALVLFLLTLGALRLSYALTVRHRKDNHDDEKGEAAFGLGQAAIFGLIALILGFSFAFATERYEARRALVVSEAVAVGRTYLKADFLPGAERDQVRARVAEYTHARLDFYADVANNVHAEGVAGERAHAVFNDIWSLALHAAQRDPRNQLTAELTNAIDQVGDISEQQAAALDNHVPTAILALVLFSDLAGAVLLGVTFGRAKSPNAVLSVVFCLLCAATVFTIVDLDNGQRGFIRLETAPLQAALDGMKRA